MLCATRPGLAARPFVEPARGYGHAFLRTRCALCAAWRRAWRCAQVAANALREGLLNWRGTKGGAYADGLPPSTRATLLRLPQLLLLCSTRRLHTTRTTSDRWARVTLLPLDVPGACPGSGGLGVDSELAILARAATLTGGIAAQWGATIDRRRRPSPARAGPTPRHLLPVAISSAPAQLFLGQCPEYHTL
jgi:hypothetical protein